MLSSISYCCLEELTYPGYATVLYFAYQYLYILGKEYLMSHRLRAAVYVRRRYLQG